VTAALTSVGFVGSVFDFRWYYVGMALATVALVGWFRPRPRVEEAEQ
jgi:hypothetical protein